MYFMPMDKKKIRNPIVRALVSTNGPFKSKAEESYRHRINLQNKLEALEELRSYKNNNKNDYQEEV
jgi:hypothetical protein